MTRSVYRFIRWRMSLNEEPDAEPMTYAMQCTLCGQHGPAGEDAEEARRWVFAHVTKPENRLHMTYREIITRPWVALPDDRRPPNSL
ncbi:hypothetical protein [Streptomyces barkulensis]|uniref:DUF7848 domain-containing protein n=1 Tax=Streptomyces barkulensis TaxID=1257026 RepID=UPI000C6C8C8D|nr:hypothetical protein [Streptomyces barkulensis]